MKRRTSKKLPHGLYPKNFPRSVKWAVDQDYADKLTPEERLWLADFNDKHYGAKFAKDAVTDWPTEERRASYIRKNTANSDAYSKCPPEMVEEIQHETTAWGDLGEMGPRSENAYHITFAQKYKHTEPVSGSADLSQTPDYLETPEYKLARDEFRSHLNKTRREVAPKPTRKLTRAAKKLAVVTPLTTDNDTNE